MNEEAAFIRAICERPDCDTTRLVFADWLEENGDPDRAEFIRTQIGDPHPKPHYPGARFSYRQHRMIDKRLGWIADVNKLLRTVGRGGIGEVNFGSYQWNEEKDGSLYMQVGQTRFTLRRGFVHCVCAATPDFLRYAPEIFAKQPVTDVDLTDLNSWGLQEVEPERMGYRGGCRFDCEMLRCSVLLYPHLKSDEWSSSGYGGSPYWRAWRTRARAEQAFSDAAVRYGRGAAGLPKWEPEKKQ